MANVKFNRGTQENLDKKIILNGTVSAAGVDGSFYLTTDTHRLYVAQGEDIVPVNEGVITVKEIKNLPNVSAENEGALYTGRFYYVSDDNILCVYNGKQWVQINPDTSIVGHSLTVETPENENKATINSILTDSNQVEKLASFSIKGNGNIKVSAEVEGENKQVILDDQGYSLSTKDTSRTDGQGAILNGVEITLENNNYPHTEGNTDTTGDTSFSVIGKTSNVKVEKNGNDIEISVGAVSLTGSSFTARGAAEGDTTTGFTLDIQQRGEDGQESNLQTSGILDPIIAVGDPKVASNQSKFKNGIAELNAYSKEDIDKKLKAVDAMTFKGSIGSDGSKPTTGVQVGDTYKYSASVTEGDAIYNIGDIIIATGPEGEDGYIPASSITWVYIPSGNDLVYRYKGEATSDTTNKTYGIDLKENDEASVASFNLKAGNVISLAGENGDNGTAQTITVNHATNKTINPVEEAAVSQQTNTALDITVKDYTFDEYGHVSGITSKKYTVLDSKTGLESVQLGATAQNNVATISTEVGLSEGGTESDSKTGTLDVKSDSLQITAATKEETKIVNGKPTAVSKSTVTVDMVWNEF